MLKIIMGDVTHIKCGKKYTGERENEKRVVALGDFESR